MICEETVMSDTIFCPNCRSKIEVSAALSAQIRNELQGEIEAAMRPEKESLAKFETEVRQREYALDQGWSALETEVSRRLAEQQDRLQLEAKNKAEQLIAVDLLDLQSQLAETKEKLGLAQQTELQFRKERREIEEQKQEVELTVSRTLDEERTKIRDDARREALDENRLREADKEKLVADLRTRLTN